jgi:hypothetical protein
VERGRETAVAVILHLAEDQYRYGAGPICLRYESTIDTVRMSDGYWSMVRGVQVRPDGTPIERRVVSVPAALLCRLLADAGVASTVHTGGIHPTTRS